jgi:GTPase SAR1 family protein
METLTDPSRRSVYDRSILNLNKTSEPQSSVSRVPRNIQKVIVDFVAEEVALRVTEISSVKLVLVGLAKVGKTSLINCFFDGLFKIPYYPTIGVDYGYRFIRVGEKVVRLDVFDLSGDDYFRECRATFLCQADCVFLCIDGTQPSSFFEIEKKWLKEINQSGVCINENLPRTQPQKCAVGALVACKLDSSGMENLHEELVQIGERIGVSVFSTSSSDGFGIPTLFLSIIKKSLNLRM